MDNLPVPLIPKIADLWKASGAEISKAALGVDIRSGQSFQELHKVLDELDEAKLRYEILYLESGDDVLIKRYRDEKVSSAGGKPGTH